MSPTVRFLIWHRGKLDRLNNSARQDTPASQQIEEMLRLYDGQSRLDEFITRDLSQCDAYSTATPCAMCQGALYWARVRRVFTESTLEQGFSPRLGC